MLEEVLPDIFRIQVPLPQNPLGALNCYLIRGHERFLIIDTGMDRQECMLAVLGGLRELSVDLNKADFSITHMHIDHLGLLANLVTSQSKVYIGEVEASLIRTEEQYERRWGVLYAVFKAHGFPEDELATALERHPGRRYTLRGHSSFCKMKGGHY